MCSIYSDFLRELDPDINEVDLDKEISTKFPTWFKAYVRKVVKFNIRLP